MSKVYSLKTIQHIPTSIDNVWEFFSSPKNLKEITPKNLGFNIISNHHGDKMYPGQIIEYKVKPLLGIPLYWMTEITQVKENEYFIDEQRYGPYSMWHHQHHFKAIEGGVAMTDIVHYKLPFWFLGDLVHPILVKGKLKEIFEVRFNACETKFGNWPAMQSLNSLEFYG